MCQALHSCNGVSPVPKCGVQSSDSQKPISTRSLPVRMSTPTLVGMIDMLMCYKTPHSGLPTGPCLVIIQLWRKHAGCIFTDWDRGSSPVLNWSRGAIIRDTVFRNMHIDAEVFDISGNGVVHLESVRMANVTLLRGRVLATTVSSTDGRHHAHLPSMSMHDEADVDLCEPIYEQDYADHFGNADVPVVRVHQGNRSIFGEEWRVDNCMAINFVFSPNLCPDVGLHKLIILDTPTNSKLNELMMSIPTDPQWARDAQLHVARSLLNEDESWLQLTRQVCHLRSQRRQAHTLDVTLCVNAGDRSHTVSVYGLAHTGRISRMPVPTKPRRVTLITYQSNVNVNVNNLPAMSI